MASAIITGLLSKNLPKSQISVSEPWEVNRAKIADLGVHTTTSNLEAARDADIVVLAVKPQVMKGVCEELSGAWSEREKGRGLPLIVSIAAGITLRSLEEWSRLKDGRVLHVVRVMPNTPALVGEGASGAFAGDGVTREERGLAEELLGSVSKVTEWVGSEGLLDVVTGLSGEFVEAFCWCVGKIMLTRGCYRVRTGVFLCDGRASRG